MKEREYGGILILLLVATAIEGLDSPSVPNGYPPPSKYGLGVPLL